MPFPEELERTAWTADGVLMGLQHRKLPLWGVQFHPESICTEYGAELLGNFLALADAHNATLEATLEATHSNASTPPSAQPHALESSHGWAYTEESPLRVSSSGSSGASSCGSAGAGATAPMGAGGCDFHGAARGAHEPETCAAASRPLQAATCPPPGCGHRKLKLLHRVLETRLEAETFYMANLSQDERSFWLDSSRREHGVARFSYMGGSTGPLSYQLRYDLPNRTLETTFPSGRKELRDKCDVLEFLEGQLQACKHSGGAAELPFEFRGGFVGYLGYELKELCEDGQGQRNRHISQEPDAVLLFADRFLVWDHQEGHVYVAALVSDGAVAEAEARAWLACTEQEVRRLSSLSLKDTLAARHQAMRDPPPLPVNARGGAVAAEGVAASAQGMSMPAGGQGILVQPLQVGAASGEEQDLQDLASHDMMEDDAPSNEPPTVDADDGEEQEPSHTPAGPGALSFPPVSPTAPSLSAGPGSVPRGAMPHADSEGGKDAVAAASALSSRESGFVSLDSARQYQDKVQQCLGHIVEGESYELCLTTRLRSRRGMRLDPLRFYQRLRAVNPAPYSALLRCGKGLTVCSSSPERFMRISAQGLCDSKPIKGTRRRGSCPEEDAEICRELRKCEKDLAENLMIVDLVRNDLGRVCTQASVCCPKIMDVETYATVPLCPCRPCRACCSRAAREGRIGGERGEYGVFSLCVSLCVCVHGCKLRRCVCVRMQVHQLVSTIQGQMRPELSRVDVLRATFPMGSMTGAPKRRSLALLDELESDARGIYSGAIGFLSLDGAVHLSVAIRTAVVTGVRSCVFLCAARALRRWMAQSGEEAVRGGCGMRRWSTC